MRKDWGQEEGGIIDEMILRETDRGGGGRLWSGWMKKIRASDQIPGRHRRQSHLQAYQPISRKRKRKTESVRGRERQKSEAPNHVEPQID